MKDVILFYNPYSGSSSTEFKSWCKKMFRCKIVTLPKKITKSFIKDHLSDEKIVVAAGGDGTVSIIASCLVNTDKLLGIVPLGTGNLLANYLKISSNPKKALEVIFSKNYKKYAVDTFLSNERNFILNMSVGKIAKVMSETTKEQKKYLGPFAYYINSAKFLPRVENVWFDLLVDGKKSKVRGEELIVTNTLNAGLRQIIFDKNIKLHDGKAHVYVIRRKSILDTLKVLLHFSKFKIKQNSIVTSYTFEKELQIKTSKKLHAQGDGDLFTKTPLKIELLHKSLNIIVPKKRKIKKKKGN